jgi:hypothetical protein
MASPHCLPQARDHANQNRKSRRAEWGNGLVCTAQSLSGGCPFRVIFACPARRPQRPSIVGCSRDSGGLVH